jgi:hypothetical protein
MREGLRPDGLVIVVESDRPVSQHGLPPAQVKCEFAALGMDLVKFKVLTSREDYLMAFRLARRRPAPDQIEPCSPQS